MKSGIVNVAPWEWFRILGNTLTLYPPPPDGLILSFEYISKAFAIGADGTMKTSFSADTDTCVFDDSLMTSGLKLKFKQAKGLDVQFELAEFQGLLEQAKAQDRSAPKISLAPQRRLFLSTANIPDGNWMINQ
jgi:hypothetical protein